MEITTPDEVVFAYILEHRLMIVTCNRNHFLALANNQVGHPGLIVLIRRKTRQIEWARLRQLLSLAGEAGIIGNINFA
jgi:hypothetical protein